MSSQFFGLYIAGSALRAANASLNTTGNNIANANTVGYSRQQVKQEASAALRTFTSYGCAGAGVDTIAIERIRESFYDVKYRHNQMGLGKSETLQYYSGMLEDYFADDKVTGFNTLFGLMSNSLQSLNDDAANPTTKANFISTLKSITDYFNGMYGNLQLMQSDANGQIKQSVDKINTIGEQLSILNRQINVIEMSGSKANDLRDQRDQLLDELSQIVDVETEEIAVTDPNDPKRLTGASNLVVKIAGGQVLANGNDYNQLICKARQNYEKANQTDIDGLYDVEWSNGNQFNLHNPVMSGRLKGLVEMRDGNNDFYFNGTVQQLGRTAAVPSNATVTINVSDLNLLDMKQCNLPEAGRINIGGQIYYYSGWEFNDATQDFTLTLDDAKCDQIIDPSKVGKEAAVGNAVRYQGIPYYMTQMNSWIRGFSEKVNDIFTSGYDSAGAHGCPVFTGNIPTGGQYSVTDIQAGTGNGLYELTAGNFAIWDALAGNSNLLGTNTNPIDETGVEEGGQIKKLIDLLDSKEMFNFRNGTARGFLGLILDDVAMNSSNATNMYTTHKALDTAISNQKTSVSGVDEDEEAVNMVKFQYSFDLASKMIQTLTEIYDRLILQTGV